MRKIYIILALLYISLPGISQQKFKGLQAIKDTFTGNVTYKSKWGLGLSPFDLYMVVSPDGNAYLYARIGYSGDKWIFFDNAIIQYDAGIGTPINYTIPFDPSTKIENVSSGSTSSYCNEYVDVLVDKDLLDILDIIVQNKSGMLRVSGKFYDNYTFTGAKIKILENMLAAYHTIADNQNDEGVSTLLLPEENLDSKPDFRKVRWGMTPSQVKAAETASFISLLSGKDMLTFATSAYGYKSYINYGFEDQRLNLALILFTIDVADYDSAYSLIAEEVSKEYGKPVFESVQQVAWETQTTKIVLLFSTKNGKRSLALTYLPLD